MIQLIFEIGIVRKKIIFKNSSRKIWQHQKNKFIFALQNKNMLRIKLHIESANWFSPKGDYTVCGACILPG